MMAPGLPQADVMCGANIGEAATDAPIMVGKIFVSAELPALDGTGSDNQNWLKLMDGFANPEDPRDTFSQSGFLSAEYSVDTPMAMDPAKLDDRAAVTDAIKAMAGYTSDLTCGPNYVGEAGRHMPNHAGIMVVVKDGEFEAVRGRFEYEGPHFAELIETEKALGLR